MINLIYLFNYFMVDTFYAPRNLLLMDIEKVMVYQNRLNLNAFL